MIRLVTVISLASALLAGHALRAAPAPRRPGDPPRAILVSAGPQAPHTKRLLAEVRDHLAGTAARIRVARVTDLPKEQLEQLALAARLARQHRARLVFWYVPGKPPRLILYHPDVEGGRLVVRPLRQAREDDPSRLAAVAAIIRSQLTALDPLPLPPPRPRPRPRPRPTKPKKSKQFLSSSLALGYEVVLPGQGASAWHAATFEARLGFGRLWGLTLAYSVVPFFQPERDGGAARIRFDRHALRAAGSFGWRGERLVATADAGLELGIWNRYLSEVPDGWDPEGGGVDLTVDLYILVRVGVRIVRRVDAFVAAGGTLALRQQQYALESPSNNSLTIFKPWAIKPVFMLGCSVRIH